MNKTSRILAKRLRGEACTHRIRLQEGGIKEIKREVGRGDEGEKEREIEREREKKVRRRER